MPAVLTGQCVILRGQLSCSQTMVFGLGMRLHVPMCTRLENGILCNGQYSTLQMTFGLQSNVNPCHVLVYLYTRWRGLCIVHAVTL